MNEMDLEAGKFALAQAVAYHTGSGVGSSIVIETAGAFYDFLNQTPGKPRTVPPKPDPGTVQPSATGGTTDVVQNL